MPLAASCWKLETLGNQLSVSDSWWEADLKVLGCKSALDLVSDGRFLCEAPRDTFIVYGAPGKKEEEKKRKACEAFSKKKGMSSPANRLSTWLFFFMLLVG